MIKRPDSPLYRGLRGAIVPRLRKELKASIEMRLAVSEQDRLVDCNPLLARVIKNRFPRRDPLNHLQVELVQRGRAGNQAGGVIQGIHRTINGIAAGLCHRGRCIGTKRRRFPLGFWHFLEVPRLCVSFF